jgi:hypothetical protein
MVGCEITRLESENRELQKGAQQAEATVAELLSALESMFAAEKAENDYRVEHIGPWPHDVKITDDVRNKWLADLDAISERMYQAKKHAREVYAKAKESK